MIALPGVWLACLSLEAGFRRRAAWSALGLAAGSLMVLALTHFDGAAYAAARLGSSASGAPAGGRWSNVASLFTGGVVVPTFGVSRWPAWPLWAWIPLAAGLWSQRRSPGLALGVWALGAVLAAFCVSSAYGFPVHRMAVALPALALLCGLGLEFLRRRLDLGPGSWGSCWPWGSPPKDGLGGASSAASRPNFTPAARDWTRCAWLTASA